MKQRILVALKTKYKTFGFSDKAFDGVADYLSKTVTEETQIETAIGGVESVLKAFQGEVDVVRNDKSGLQKQLDELKAKTEKPDSNPNPNPEEKKDEVPSWAQILLDSNKTLSEKLASFEANKAEQERGVQIMAKAKENGIPENLIPMLKIEADADLDTYFKDAKQTFANLGFAGVVPPEGGGSPESESDALAGLIKKGTEEIVKSKTN